MPIVRCFVPSCEGTDPEVAIPLQAELRKKWFSALGIKSWDNNKRERLLFGKAKAKICKGHFQFPGEENDPEAVPQKSLRGSIDQSEESESLKDPPLQEEEKPEAVAKEPSETDKKDCRRAHVVLTRVDTDRHERPDAAAEIKANLSLEATSRQIKTLFRIKDDVEALCEGAFQHNLNFGHVVLLATEFYQSKNPEVKEGWKTLLPAEDLPTDEEQNMADIRPIKINMACSTGTLQEFQNNLKRIFSQLKKLESDMNLYWVLNEVFRFALANECEFIKATRPKVSLAEPKKRVRVRCEVCNDWCGATEYCGAFTCPKCRLFFQSVMREKTLFSLRCARENRCDLSVDLSCRRCRADKCVKLDMLVRYHEAEMAHPMSRVCVACTVQGGARDDDVSLGMVRGHLLCIRCQGFFDQTVELNQREHRPGQLIGLRNMYVCKEEESKCVITSTSENCHACLWDKMVTLGLNVTFLTKFQGFKTFSPSCGDYDLCAVCDNETSDCGLWMGQLVCQPCRSFLELSMRLESHLSYCCPNGESNRLCPIIDSLLMDDDETSLVPLATRCKYCWFRRLEIEGLVDRWIICGGRTDLWIDPEDIAEIDSYDSEDAEITFKQPDPVKSETVV